MVDIGLHTRKAYFDALTGQIIVSGSVIPIADEKLEVNINEHDLYILMTSQEEQTDGIANKSMFVNDMTIKLVIINQRRATNSKELVEDVSNQILNILFPTRTTWALSLTEPLDLVFARLTSASYNPLAQNDKGFIISKELSFKNRITQN